MSSELTSIPLDGINRVWLTREIRVLENFEEVVSPWMIKGLYRTDDITHPFYNKIIFQSEFEKEARRILALIQKTLGI